MSDKYKMISELGLKIYDCMVRLEYGEYVVNAKDLESLLAKGVEVCGQGGFYCTHPVNDSTHKALLINIKPIQKLEAVGVEELIEFVRKGIGYSDSFDREAEKMVKRLKDHGVVK